MYLHLLRQKPVDKKAGLDIDPIILKGFNLPSSHF